MSGPGGACCSEWPRGACCSERQRSRVPRDASREQVTRHEAAPLLAPGLMQEALHQASWASRPIALINPASRGLPCSTNPLAASASCRPGIPVAPGPPWLAPVGRACSSTPSMPCSWPLSCRAAGCSRRATPQRPSRGPAGPARVRSAGGSVPGCVRSCAADAAGGGDLPCCWRRGRTAAPAKPWGTALLCLGCCSDKAMPYRRMRWGRRGQP